MTQNEKDRELLDEVFYQMRDGGTQIINDVSKVQLAKLFDLAHRLLTERENAEVVYKLNDKKRAETHYYKNTSYLYNDEFKQEKGIWIPIEEGLIE
ncbi:hypothetical protein [Listeria booriae]|uniref:hypothetical protein n=1 Tax=Listeria booriae TaxID=1552123 RepID=UPI0016278E79|nr:hypothetical protein [Listeria booriae]MBC2190518.1 hypothetical protein [Listeria booriae]